jgi:uncharacterized protein (DUF4415 family)
MSLIHDPDDAPDLGPDWFAKAELKIDGKPVNRGGRPRGSNKERISLRVDRDILEAYRASGTGWQSRMNDDVRKAIGKR